MTVFAVLGKDYKGELQTSENEFNVEMIGKNGNG